MNGKPLIFLSFLLLVIGSASGNELPICVGENRSKWTNCRGELKFPNGDFYSGDFVDGKFSGFGQLVSKTGTSYIGEWLDNVPHGLGKAIFSDGRIPAEGLWQSGSFKKPQAVELRGINQLQKPSHSDINVNCKVESNPVIKIPYAACVKIGGEVQGASNMKCIIGNNPPIFLAPELCGKANGLIVN